MQVQVWQAALFGLLACLASMPGLGGTVLGNYTLGRPLVAGLIVGLIMGDVQTGIYLGAAIQVVYIALVTPGGTVSADVRAISYIGIPLSMVAVHSMGLNPASQEGQAMAVTLGCRRHHRHRAVLRHGNGKPRLAAHGLARTGKG